jgi:LytS/YehU family sensor histidine kinase
LITLQGQINPHFLSNSLAATDTFIASGNTDKANQYLGEVRNLMREMIDYTGKEYIPMEEEIGLLTRYLTAEQIRVEYLFDFDIIKEDIRIDNILIAPSMIQPFVENSIKHAFRDLERKKGMIRIIFKQESKAFLTCFIDDNGVGKRSLTGTFPAPKRKSKGDELIKERLDLYNKLNKTNLHFDTQNLFPGEKFPGTRVKIQIPCKFIS